MKELEDQYVKTRSYHVKLMTRILGGDWAAAEDVVQEAYCRALQYLPSYDAKRGALLPWFNRIMFNALRDVQREYKNRPKETCDELCAEDLLVPVVNSHHILGLIDGVKNPRHQRVLYLFYVLGYNSREVSEIEEDMTQTNVTTIVSSFRKGLADGK